MALLEDINYNTVTVSLVVRFGNKTRLTSTRAHHANVLRLVVLQLLASIMMADPAQTIWRHPCVQSLSVEQIGMRSRLLCCA